MRLDLVPSWEVARSHLLQSVVAVALAARLLSRQWRPARWPVVVLAVPVTYLALRLAHDNGFSEWIDHRVLERIGGEIDDLSSWLVAVAAAGVMLVVARAWRDR